MPTSPWELGLLAALVLAFAALYSSGGHAGASAYLAAMALFGIDPEVMKPTALVMNIVVAIVGTSASRQRKQFPGSCCNGSASVRYRRPFWAVDFSCLQRSTDRSSARC